MDKVRIIKRSLLCYNLSFFSLLPWLGVIPGAWAILLFWQVTDEAGEQWNPARKYALRGFFVACAGLLLSSLVWLFSFALMLKNFAN